MNMYSSRFKVYLCLYSMSFAAMFCTGCASDRVIQVVNDEGQPVSGALVLYREVNMSPFWNRVHANYANASGKLNFKAVNLVRVEAFDSEENWGELWLASNKSGTVVVVESPYEGSIADYYLQKTSQIPPPINAQLQALTRGSE